MNKFWPKFFPFLKKKSENDKNLLTEENDFLKGAQKIVLNSYDEVQYATKILLEQKKIIIVLEIIKKAERRRIIDFLSGVVYVNKGRVSSLGVNRYLFQIN